MEWDLLWLWVLSRLWLLFAWFLSLLSKQHITHVTLELGGFLEIIFFVEETLVELGLSLVGS
jgi:hypothetical protein